MATVTSRLSRPTHKTFLSVGRIPVATVEHYIGGEPFAEVVSEPGGLLPYAKKHLGDLFFADLQAEVAMDAHPTLFRWIRDAWFGDPSRDKVILDTQELATSTVHSLELAHASIREVTLPALDLGSREKRFLSLRVGPRGAFRSEGGTVPLLERPERDFHAQNFNVKIDGIDCSSVIAVDAISVKTVLAPPGSNRKPKLIFPDLHLYVDPERAQPFRDWFDDFVIAGNNSDEAERDGAITYLDPLLSDSLAALDIKHLGIYRVADEPATATSPRRTRVDLYLERMELVASDSAPTGDTQAVEPLRLDDENA